MTKEEEQSKKFDLMLENARSIGKAQSFYVNALLLSLAAVWCIETLHQAGGITIGLLGASIQVSGLWPLVPFVTGALVLAIIGNINIYIHACRRLDLHIAETFSEYPWLLFAEMDSHKNVIDYWSYLSLSLSKPVLPDSTKDASKQPAWRPSSLLYPALVLASIYTCSFTLRRVPITWGTVIAVNVSVLLQAAFSLGFLRQHAHVFCGLGPSLDWGPGGIERMSAEAVSKILQHYQVSSGKAKAASAGSSSDT